MVTEDKQSPWQQEEGDLLGSSTVYQQQHEVEDEEGSNKDGQEEGDGGPVREHGSRGLFIPGGGGYIEVPWTSVSFLK